MHDIKIIHEPTNVEPFLIVEKPAGLPSAPLSKNNSENAVSKAAELFPQIKTVRNLKNAGATFEYGLLHRLDTATRGLLLFATKQDFYDHILLEQDRGNFVKTYSAECEIDMENAKKLDGFPPAPNSKIAIESYFRPYGTGRRAVRPVLETSSGIALKKVGAKKLYSTKILSLEQDGKLAKIKCSITQGFRHQVRCHLAWLGYPVIGDALYNYEFCQNTAGGAGLQSDVQEMRFFAIGMEFPDLYSGKMFRFWL